MGPFAGPGHSCYFEYSKELSIVETVLMEKANGLPRAKLCRVIKSSDGKFSKYGFTCKYHNEISMEVVEHIIIGSSAQLGGLELEDRIVSVNGVNIIGKSHSETVSLIRQHENHFVCMVVSKADHENWIKANRQPNEWEAIPHWRKDYGDLGIPRNCHVEKEKAESYGFHLASRVKTNIPYIKAVTDNSQASQAGLKVDDILYCVNDKNIVCCIKNENRTGWSHKKVVGEVGKSPKSVLLTVIDEKASKLFSTLGITITQKLAQERVSR